MRPTETRYLKAKMSEAERLDALTDLPQVLDQLDIAVDEKKRTAKEYGERIKDLEESKERLREEIRSGMRYKDIDCAWQGDTLVRLDTMEVIDIRESDEV